MHGPVSPSLSVSFLSDVADAVSAWEGSWNDASLGHFSISSFEASAYVSVSPVRV